jgi:hypothetical protein
MKEIIEVTKTLTEISLIVGEIYADAQIEYCKEKENDRND